ncbi:hypothetical protein ACFCW2_13720 [Qipengyuania sp. DSG2-2]|uniref:hypothetical protein n=1 Tax=Qipengyuania sp. DGS2-2 TaxID=3349631 RepID=UPI0036D3E13F
MIEDLLSDKTEWWDAELRTIAGATREEFEGLLSRSKTKGFVPDEYDQYLLRAAANNLTGYPGISTTQVERKIGEDWRNEVSVFLQRSN